MEEYRFGRTELDRLLHVFQHEAVWEIRSSQSLRSSNSLPVFLALSRDQTDRLEKRLERHLRLNQKRTVDWLATLIDINSILCTGVPALRTTSVVLVGPEKWMAWIAPPEDIRHRAYGVVSGLLARPPTLANLLAIFPAVLLLHPFKDGNCRSALVFMDLFNRCHQLIDNHLLESICIYFRGNRREMTECLSRIRVLEDIGPYIKLINRIGCENGKLISGCNRK